MRKGEKHMENRGNVKGLDMIKENVAEVMIGLEDVTEMMLISMMEVLLRGLVMQQQINLL